MRTSRKLILLLVSLLLLIVSSASATETQTDFSTWLKGFQEDALKAGISQQTLTAAFSDIKKPLARVIELDRNQPEFTQSLTEYVGARVSAKRIAGGEKMLKRYPTWLGRVEQQYKVPRQLIVALWGIETNYGAHSGSFSVIRSLATLTHDGRRSSYFYKELLDALRIIDAGHIRASRMKGSWAGAMGQCQFMPSSFRRYAVDADNDGRINIWSSIPDVLASAANYLKGAGWQDGQPWGQLASITKNFDLESVGLKIRQPVSYWKSHGVAVADHAVLPQDDLPASLIMPDGPQGQAYLVYPNFRVLLAWNNSNAFAIAVGTLSDRLSITQKGQ